MPAEIKSTAKEPMAAAAGKQPNMWLIISIILAVALVGVIFTNYSKMSQDDGLVVIGADQAGQSLLDFINEIYGAQVGAATLGAVTEESGLYQVVVSVIDPQTNQPVDQTIFITRDGKYFVPQVVDIEAVVTQYRTLQQQQQLQPEQPTVELEPVDDGAAGTVLEGEPVDEETPEAVQ